MIQIPIDFYKDFKHLYRRIIPKSKYFNKNTITIYNNDTIKFQYYISKNNNIYFDNHITPIFLHNNLIKNKYNYNNTLNKNTQKYTCQNDLNNMEIRYSCKSDLNKMKTRYSCKNCLDNMKTRYSYQYDLIKDYNKSTGTNNLTIRKSSYVCTNDLNKNYAKYLCNNIKYLSKYITKSLRFERKVKYLKEFNIIKYTSSNNILLYTKNCSINQQTFLKILPNTNIVKNITLLPPQVFVKSNQVFLIPI